MDKLLQIVQEPGRRSAAKLLTKDEARRIAAHRPKRTAYWPFNYQATTIPRTLDCIDRYQCAGRAGSRLETAKDGEE
jgi:hypothetical protein